VHYSLKDQIANIMTKPRYFWDWDTSLVPKVNWLQFTGQGEFVKAVDLSVTKSIRLITLNIVLVTIMLIKPWLQWFTLDFELFYNRFTKSLELVNVVVLISFLFCKTIIKLQFHWSINILFTPKTVRFCV
jgi:hypothetical protein